MAVTDIDTEAVLRDKRFDAKEGDHDAHLHMPAATADVTISGASTTSEAVAHGSDRRELAANGVFLR